MTIGILVDVSGSMRSKFNLDTDNKESENTRIKSTFETVFSIIKQHQVNYLNDTVFALAFGLRHDPYVYDLISMCENYANSAMFDTKQACLDVLSSPEYSISNCENYVKEHGSKYYISGIDPLDQMLIHNGAPYCRQYLDKHLTENQAGQFFSKYHERKDLLAQIVKELPDVCKNEDSRKSYDKAKKTAENVSKVNGKLATASVGAAGVAGAAGAAAVGTTAATAATVVTTVTTAASATAATATAATAATTAASMWTLASGAAVTLLGPAAVPVGILVGAASVAGITAVGAKKVNKSLVENEDIRAEEAIKRATKLITDGLIGGADGVLQKSHIDHDIICQRNCSNVIKTIDMIEQESKLFNSTTDMQPFIDAMEPYIYGRTPMKQSIVEAAKVFDYAAAVAPRAPDAAGKKNILIIVSDGLSTDGDPSQGIAALKQRFADMMVVACYVTDKNIEDPKQLFYQLQNQWDSGAKALFNMASEVKNSNPALSTLSGAGWKLPLAGVTRLFVQVNKPEIMTEFCKGVDGLHTNRYALVDLIGQYHLNQGIFDEYRNQKARKQFSGTCWANATSLVLRMAMMRIYNRDGGVPLFFDLRAEMLADLEKNALVELERYRIMEKSNFKELKKIIDDFGDDGENKIAQYCSKYGIISKELTKKASKLFEGQNTSQVLKKYCKKYRLDCCYLGSHSSGIVSGIVDWFSVPSSASTSKYASFGEDKARRAVNAKRPVVATFRLDGKQWYKFSAFFGANSATKRGILTATDLVYDAKTPEHSAGGHAVVLIEIGPNYLKFINSWGSDQWGDNGCFKIENAAVLGVQFYDVFWTTDMLTDNEKKKYEEFSRAQSVAEIKSIFPNINDVEINCPKCDMKSSVKEYNGNILSAVCPHCNGAL